MPTPQQLLAYLTGTLGYTPTHAAALVGNMQQESSLNPTDMNRKEGAFGLLNWRGERLGNLQQFAQQQGKPISDWQTQLDFIKHEMGGSESRSAAGFMGAQNLEQANNALQPYVRYGDNSQATRFKYAQNALGQPAAAPVAGPQAPRPPGNIPAFAVAPGREPDLGHVHPALVQAVQQGAQTLPPGFTVQVNEGFNPNGHAAGSQHHIAGSGALDVQIVDPQGNIIPNRGQDTTGLYTQLAKGSYGAAQQLGVGDKFAWGGRFGTVSGGNTPDLMHFDLGGDRGRFLQPLAQMFGGNTQVAQNAPQPFGGPMPASPVALSEFDTKPDTSFGHSPQAVADAQKQQVFTPPQGQTIQGKPWEFPAMSPMPAGSNMPQNVATNLPNIGLKNPGADISPFTVAGLPSGPLVAGPQVAAATPQAPSLAPQAPTQMAQNTGIMGQGGFNPMGLLGGLGSLAGFGSGQAQLPQAPPAPRPNAHLLAFQMQPPDLTALKELFQLS